MKFKDYYQILGVSRDANTADIKKAYRKLAHQYHPDISKDPKGEEKFKEVNEAYKTLKDPELRKAYDELGRHAAGENFQPPPDWASHFSQAGMGGFSTADFASAGGFEGIDLSDLFEELARARGGQSGRWGFSQASAGQGKPRPMPGQDFEVTARISLEDAARGTLVELNLDMPEYDGTGHLRRVPRSFKARIPKGVVDGQKLRLSGKGGKGLNGGKDGDLYLNIALQPHPWFRPSEHDLYLDVPVSPWEAALGATIEAPTLDGNVSLKIPPGSPSGRKMRLAGKGLPKPGDGHGDLYVILQITLPPQLTETERELLQQLAQASAFKPRSHFNR
ncbi:MAG: DnaJ C-terminal domain-containing protein [Methylococcus sp.]